MRRFLKVVLYIIGSLFLLVLAAMLALQTKWGENLVREKVVDYLKGKLQTEFVIKELNYRLPTSVELKGVVLIDKKEDTLLSLGRLKVNIKMLALIRSKIAVNNLVVEDLHAHIYRSVPDSLFNFNYIIEAFASKEEVKEEPEKADTAASKLTFDVSRVELSNINLRYDDTSGGTFFAVNLAHLLLRPKQIDLDQNIFSVKEFNIAGLKSIFITDTSYLPPPPEDTAASADFQFVVDNMELKDVAFKMLNRTDSMYMNYAVGHLKTDLKQFGLKAQFVELGELLLEDADAEIVMGKPSSKQPEEVKSGDSTSNNWRVLADKLAINKLNFLMDDNSQPRQKSGLDYAHLNIRDFFFNAQGIVYSSDTISADLKHLVLKEQSGLNIQELRAKVLYHGKGARLTDFYLLTPQTMLQDQLLVSYPSLESLSEDMDKMQLDINLDKSKIGINDLLYFLPPEQQGQFLAYKGQAFVLTAKMKGYLSALLIDRLFVSGLNGTVLDLNGKLNGLPDSKKLFYDLDLNVVRTTYKDIAPFLPDSLKQQLRIPEWIALNGKVRGGVEDYFPDLFIRTADGNAAVKGFLKMSPGENREEYDIVLTTQTLNLGKILRQEDSVLGAVTLVADVKGRSFDPQYMNTAFNARIASANAMQYNYSDINLTGSILENLVQFKGLSSDPNIDFDLDGHANLSNTYPEVYADLRLRNADLYALKLMQDTLQLKGDIVADFPSLNPDYPAGSFSWLNGHVIMPGTSMPLDSILFTSSPQDSVQDIFLNASNILFTSLTGHIPLTQIGNAMLSHVNRHYRLQDTVVSTDSRYDMQLDGFVKYSPLINRWMPDLKPFDTVKFNSAMGPESLNVNAYIPQIIFGQNRLDSGVVVIRENRDTFSYMAGLKEYNSGSMQLWYPTVRGLIKNDSIYALANIKDSAFKNQFTLGGSMTQGLGDDSSLTYVRLFSGLRFDYERWDVNPNNRIVLSPEGFFIRDFNISKDNQSIAINSKEAAPQSPLAILIQNFELANVTSMISKDTLLAEGQLNVDADVDLRDSFPKFNALVAIKDLKAFEQPVGRLDMNAKNESDNIYRAQVKLSEQGNDVVLKGSYFLNAVNNNNFDFVLNINTLALKSVEGLTFGAIRNSSGGLTGALKINGTADAPNIVGDINTKDLATTVSMLNAPFSMLNEKIIFRNNSIILDDFRIRDYKDRTATISGNVKTPDFKDYLLDLNFNARRWQPVHSTKEDNEEFYGDLIMSANLNIKGAATAPKIDGSLTLHDSTDFTYAMIDKGPGIVEHEGIVEFFDSRDTFYVDSTQIVNQNRLRLNEATQVNVNVDIEKEATFSVLIDPASGDMLQVRGDAQLNTFLAPDGSIGLTGVYELESGYYELNYNFLRRKFNIQQGSVITLSGDPLDAEADISAAYDANVAPYDLVEKQATAEQLVYYKQRLPFQVLLKIKGKVMEPEISFDIVLPEEKSNVVSSDVANLVQAKLSEIRLDPSEMNKQVFAILILGRFISEDPFSSGTGGGMEYAVRQSVSKFLSEQLNHLAEGLVTGLELNVGLNTSEDYSTGTKQNRTDLELSASKRFLDDRLKITVGNNFELEGQAAQNQKSSVIPGDLSVDYQLTKDGRYVIRAYRSNELQNLVDGYTVETGLSFRLSLEYNRFRTIFMNRKKYRARMRERRREQRSIDNERNIDAKLEEDISFIQKQAPLK